MDHYLTKKTALKYAVRTACDIINDYDLEPVENKINQKQLMKTRQEKKFFQNTSFSLGC